LFFFSFLLGWMVREFEKLKAESPWEKRDLDVLWCSPSKKTHIYSISKSSIYI
jgi:hypothetical protein